MGHLQFKGEIKNGPLIDPKPVGQQLSKMAWVIAARIRADSEILVAIG
jgi:hypothetical protein